MDNEEQQVVLKAIHELVEANDFENAFPLIDAVLEADPNNAPALHFLGYVYLMGGQYSFAYQAYRRALQEHPGNHALWTSLGRAAHELNRHDEAIKCFLKSAEINPEYAMAYANAAATFAKISKWEDAEKSARLALECDPNDLPAHLNLAHALLAQGKWKEGWQEWGKSLGCKYRKEWVYGDETRWDGSPDKRVVIYGEQGLGDEIFYASCVPDAIEISQKVWIDCDPKLEGLFKRSFPRSEVHGTRRDESPNWIVNASIEHRCAIGGLPEFFRNDSKTFPRKTYLVADPERRLMWRALFDSWGKKVIGITTHGGAKHTNAAGRKIEFDDLLPLLEKDYAFVSLDYQPDDTELDEELNGVKIHKFPFATQSQDYDDTAALIAELDYVVGVPTTAQHCAAAMGVQTICLVPQHHQWRYGQPSMPWYRTMRLIYQGEKTWAEVIKSVDL